MPKKKTTKKKTAPRRQKKKKSQAGNKATKAVGAAAAALVAKPKKKNLSSFLRKHLPGYIIDQFGDEAGIAWIQYWDKDQKHFCEIDSVQFRDFLRSVIIQYVGPMEHWMEQTIRYLETTSRRNKTKRLWLRSARHDGDWWLHINDTQATRIRKGKWEVTELPTIFRTFSNQKPIIVDEKATIKDLDLLKPLLNMPAGEKELFLDCLAAHLIPGLSRPITLARGAPGSGKSTLGKLMKRILDPSTSNDEGTDFPKEERDWAATARRHSYSLFDNVGKLTPTQQDICCRMVTGTSLQQRKLYSNFDTVEDQIKTAFSINTVDLTGLQSDFLDRSIIYDMERLEDEDRMGDEEFNRKLAEIMPKIAGALCCILAEARTIIEQIKPEVYFRLHDFAVWAAACARVRGRSGKVFFNELELKIQLQKDESIAQNPVVEPLLKFMSNQEEWEGSAKDLLKQLQLQEFGELEGEGVDEKMKVRKHNIPDYFPKSPEALGKKIRYGMPLFKYSGLKVSFPRKKSKRIIRISHEKVLAKKTVTTVTPPNLSTIKGGDSS